MPVWLMRFYLRSGPALLTIRNAVPVQVLFFTEGTRWSLQSSEHRIAVRRQKCSGTLKGLQLHAGAPLGSWWKSSTAPPL
jgi:hypothetical protein